MELLYTATARSTGGRNGPVVMPLVLAAQLNLWLSSKKKR